MIYRNLNYYTSLEGKIMQIGLKLQRKHRAVGYRIKYFYYFLMRREILQKRVSYGEKNKHKIIYVIKPDYQDGVEGLMSLLSRQLVYLNYAEKKKLSAIY